MPVDGSDDPLGETAPGHRSRGTHGERPVIVRTAMTTKLHARLRRRIEGSFDESTGVPESAQAILTMLDVAYQNAETELGLSCKLFWGDGKDDALDALVRWSP